MEHLTSSGILHGRLSTENVLVSAGFYLKLGGMEFTTNLLHRSNTHTRLKRTHSVSETLTCTYTCGLIASPLCVSPVQQVQALHLNHTHMHTHTHTCTRTHTHTHKHTHAHTHTRTHTCTHTHTLTHTHTHTHTRAHTHTRTHMHTHTCTRTRTHSHTLTYTDISLCRAATCSNGKPQK